MFKSYKVIYKIITEKGNKPIQRTYCFSCQNKRIAFQIANDILCDYITDMKFFSGSIKSIKEIK